MKLTEEQAKSLWHYAARRCLSPHEWEWSQSEQEEMADGINLLLNERTEYDRLRKCENRQTASAITRAREAEKAQAAAETRAGKAEKELQRVLKNFGLGPDGRVFKEKKHG